MKVYGYDDTGPARGELIAADVDNADLVLGPKPLAQELGWDALFTRFTEARQSLLREMESAGADDDLINTVRNTKAHYVPVVHVARF